MRERRKGQMWIEVVGDNSSERVEPSIRVKVCLDLYQRVFPHEAYQGSEKGTGDRGQLFGILDREGVHV